MKKIYLTSKNFTQVDDEDYDFLNQWRWGDNKYASRREDGLTIYMHKVLLSPPTGMSVDHKNGDSLDNRKLNLRICTAQQNSMNRKSHSETGLKGVAWDNHAHKWNATIGLDRKKIHLGYYHSKDNAALAYKLVSRIFFGEFAFAARDLDTSASI